jgi:hypothetical protein
MPSWTASMNASPGSAATLKNGSLSVPLTPTSEVSITERSQVGYLGRRTWRTEQDPANASPSSARLDDLPNKRDSTPRPTAEVVVGLKKWEGRILEVSDDLLTVELTPSDHDGPELVADFDPSLLGPDSSSAALGDILYLTTRTVRDASGYPYQTSSLKLRRPGPWAEDELREIQDIAKRQAEFFKGT